jgi:hypothetical protein
MEAMDRDTNTLVVTIRTDNKDSKQDTSKLFTCLVRIANFGLKHGAGI